MINITDRTCQTQYTYRPKTIKQPFKTDYGLILIILLLIFVLKCEIMVYQVYHLVCWIVS